MRRQVKYQDISEDRERRSYIQGKTVDPNGIGEDFNRLAQR
jgi:hypothetical protein